MENAPVSHYDDAHADRTRRRIDITEESECRFWAERLGVRPTELEAAVGAVGNEINDVWLYVDRLKHDELL